MDKAYAVPLHELLAGVPRDTRLEITDPDGYGIRFIPVGRYCHEAAEALRAAPAQPEPEECDGGQCGIGGYCKQCPKTQPEHPDAQGSPCPEFWNWLPKAYGQTESFSKYNMEVAYLAGKQSQPEPEPVTDKYLMEVECTKCGAKQDGILTVNAPPQRKWQGLTDAEVEQIVDDYWHDVDIFIESIEAKLKEKNT